MSAGDVDLRTWKSEARALPLGHALRALAEGLPDVLSVEEYVALSSTVYRLTHPRLEAPPP
jgi:hypothetical protein